MITIVLPVYNEEIILHENVTRLTDFCRKNFYDEWRIVISDNNSSDATASIASNLVEQIPEVNYYFIASQGKGYGVLEAWKQYTSDINIYMDVDLSTDISSLPHLVKEIVNGSDIVVGSRFAPGSSVTRSRLRMLISRGLHILVSMFLGLSTTDTPCGFKAVNRHVVDSIVDQIDNRTWFFDTEMLWRAERAGMRVTQIPVTWKETHDATRKSRVNVFGVMMDYGNGIRKLYVQK